MLSNIIIITSNNLQGVKKYMTCLPLESPSGHKIYIGPRPDAAPDDADAKKFDALQIKTAIVFLSDKEKADKPIDPFYTARKINQLNFPIPDAGTPSSVEAVNKLFTEVLPKAIEEGNVYMHCKFGRGRTALMVTCGIILKKGLDAKSAITAAGNLVSGLSFSKEQYGFLNQFEKAHGPSKKAAAIQAGPSASSSSHPALAAAQVGPSASSSAPIDANPFAKHLLPFKSVSGFELYASPCPKLAPWLGDPEKMFTTVAVLLSQEECTKYDIKNYYDSRNIQQIYFPIPDAGTPDSVEKAHEFIEQLFKALEEGNLCLHCRLGKGRTALMLACIAIQKKGMTAKEALAFTQNHIYAVTLATGQQKFINSYYATYYSKASTLYYSKADAKQPTEKAPVDTSAVSLLIDYVAKPSEKSLADASSGTGAGSLGKSPVVAGPNEVVTPPKPKVPFAKQTLPFETGSEFKLYAGTCPTVYPKKELKPHFKTVAAVLTDDEAVALGLKEHYTSIEIEQIYFSFSEQGVPESAAKTQEFIEQLYTAAATGHVYIHSCGTPDRTGLILACMAILKKGMSGEEALVYARSLISKVMTKSPAQEEFVRSFGALIGKKEAS